MLSRKQVEEISMLLSNRWGDQKISVGGDLLSSLVETALELHELLELQPKCVDCPPDTKVYATFVDSEHEPCCEEHAAHLHNRQELPTAEIMRRVNEEQKAW